MPGAAVTAGVTAAVRRALADADVAWREVAPGEWGLEAAAGGWPLHVGVAVRDGLLGARAEALAAGVADPHELLHRNRRLRLVRFAQTRAGAVWVEGAVPAAVAGEWAGRLLGELVVAADDLRAAHAGARG